MVIVLLIAANIFIPNPVQHDVRIVTPPSIIASLPHWVAEERGFYNDAGLKVSTINITASNLMVQALIEGSADVLPAVSLVDVINVGAKKTSRPLIFSHSRMPTDTPFEALVVPSGSSISTLRDLAGKKIAVYPGTTAREAVRSFLADSGVDTSGITFVQLKPPEHLPALERGDVSASHIYDPHRTYVLHNGRTRMLSGSVYAALNTDSAIGVSVISLSFYQNHPKAATRYLEVWDRSVDFIRDHNKEAREILQERLHLLPLVAQNATWVNATKVAETSRAKVQETAKTFQDIGVIDSNVVVDDSFFLP